MLRPLALVPILILLGASAVPLPAIAADGTLPGGTPISVTIDSPANNAVLPPGPVTVAGTARIGEGQTPQPTTGLVYVLDVSGSTRSAVTGCSGDENQDHATDPTNGNPINDIVDCEIAAARTANDRAVSNGTVGQVGVVVFGTNSASADMSPTTGDQQTTAAGATESGGRDVNVVLESVNNRERLQPPQPPVPAGRVDQFTRKIVEGDNTHFAAAVRSATATASATQGQQKIVIFMSDGVDNPPTADPVDGPLDDAHRAGIVFHTFAIGSASRCGDKVTGNTLAKIADKTDGTCKEVKTVSDLLGAVPAVIAAQLNELTLTVDDDRPVTIPNDNISPPLPQTGPKTVRYHIDTRPLDTRPHTLCVTAHGTDHGPGREGSVTECHTVIVNAAPVVRANGPYTGTHGKPVQLNGTLDDDEPKATVTWSVDPRAGCTFADAHALSTTVTCTEQGTFDLTLTADDRLHPPVASSTKLTIINEAPKVSAGGPYTGPEDQPIPIEGTATDADDPQLTVKWSVSEGVPCTFADATKLSTTVTCTEHDTFDLILTVGDGKNPPVTAKTTVTAVNQLPVVSAGGPYTGLDNTPVPITGTAVDPDSPGLTSTWSFTRVTAPPTADCAFGDPLQLSTVVTCTTDGIYTLILTVDDKAHDPVVVRTTLTLGLRPGALSLASFVNPAPGFVGGDPVVVTFTVRNGGVSPMASTRLTISLPAGLQPTSTFPAGCASTCNLGTLVPGQTVQVTLTFAVDKPLDQALSAVLTTQGPDVDAGDNITRAGLTILQPTLTVDPTIGPQGFVTRATGRNFPAGARVKLQWSIGISDNPGEVTVGPDGTIDAQVLIFPKDARGVRVLSALPVSGPKFGAVPANPFLVVSRALKPKTFIVR